MDSTRERVRKALDALVYLPVDDAVIPQSSKQSSKPGDSYRYPKYAHSTRTGDKGHIKCMAFNLALVASSQELTT